VRPAGDPAPETGAGLPCRGTFLLRRLS